MGFYSQVIVPLLCDFGLDRPFVARYRRELLAHASGNILEVGFGTGLNLPYYSPHVRKVTTVDPNVGMYRRARRRIKQARIEVDRWVLGGERLPFEDGTFDCVVSTFTLCSIEDVPQALREVYRVLKAGGDQFSLVGIPLKAFPAVRSRDLPSAHLLHADCGQRLRYAKQCPTHGPVEAAAIVRGYEYGPGHSLA
jgi:ubiquinone/menaquinone biosynthesis C-methylase UbiE